MNSSGDKDERTLPEAVYVWWSDMDQQWRIRKWDMQTFVEGTKYFREPVTPSAIEEPTHPEIARYRNTFRAELDKRMDPEHPSMSPSTEAHAVALRQFVKNRNALTPSHVEPTIAANPERRSSLEHSEVKPDGNERRSGAVDSEGGSNGGGARGDAVLAGGAERGARPAGGEADLAAEVGAVAGSVESATRPNIGDIKADSKRMEREFRERMEAEIKSTSSTPPSIGRIPALEATRTNAEYWLDHARGCKTLSNAVIHAEQAINAWKNAAYAAHDKLLALSATQDTLDAARYRWLRNKSVPPHNFYLSVPVEFAGVSYKPHEVDAAIDAAIASSDGGNVKT